MNCVKAVEKGREIVKRIERIKLSLPYWVAYVYGVFLVRGITERLLEAAKELPKPIHLFVHWPLWNLNFLLTFILIIFFVTKSEICRISKAVFVFSFLLLIVPFVDFVVSGGKGYVLGYAMSFDRLLGVIFSMGGVIGNSIITPGQSLAIWIALCLIFAYVALKTNSVLKASTAVILCYSAGVFYSSFPMFLAMGFGLESTFNQQVLFLTILFLGLLGIAQSILCLYFYKKEKKN